MKKIIYTIGIFLLLALTGSSVNATWTDAQGRQWNIKYDYATQNNYGQLYQDIADRMYNTTTNYLNTHNTIDLGELETLLADDTCSSCAPGTLYGGYAWSATTSWKNLRMGCANHMVATFDYACPDIQPEISCNSITLKSDNITIPNVGGKFVIYAGRMQKPLTITGVDYDTIKEHDCNKYGPDGVIMSLKNGVSVVGTSNKKSIATKTTVGTILENENFKIRKSDGTDLVQIGTYNMTFQFYLGSSSFHPEVTGATCKIEIIADTAKCGVDSSGNWNGNGNGILDTGEECDITSTGAHLGVWGNGTPGCDANCLKKGPICGNGIVEDGETCDDGDTDDGDGCSAICQLEPKISIYKYSNNASGDSDGNSTLHTNDNDSQTIVKGHSSLFEIKIKNTGEDDLIDITLTDEKVVNCATASGETIDLENSKFINGNNNNINITVTGSGTHDNYVLEKGEIITYNCELPNTTIGYTNTIIVDAKGYITGVNTNDDDDSKVLINGPSITIEKFSLNDNDLDGNKQHAEGLDESQTVNSGEEAVFGIKVTNTGNKSLTGIVLTDTNASNCSGNVEMPADSTGNAPTSFLNIQQAGVIDSTLLNNGVLDPNEYFTFRCTKNNTINDYTNTIKVDAETLSGEGVSDTNKTDIIVHNPGDGYCGDGTKDTGEKCDDGNNTNGDGCSASCENEGGGSIPSCNSITTTPSTGSTPGINSTITCKGNSKVKSFMLDCGDGSNAQFANATYIFGNAEATFTCNYSSSVSKTFKPKCYVSGLADKTDPSYMGWSTRLSVCQGKIKIGAGTGVGGLCKDGNPNGIKDTGEECDPLDYNLNKGWGTAGCSDNCEALNTTCYCDNNDNWVNENGQNCDLISGNNPCINNTIPGGWNWQNPVYANFDDNKLVCLKVVDRFGNDINMSYFDLFGASSVTGNDEHIDDIKTGIRGLNISQLNSDSDTGYITNNEAVTIEKAAFIDSHFCVLMKSKAPGKKKFTFDVWIPTHKENTSLTWDGGYRHIQNGESSMDIEFLKPFVGKFIVTESTGGEPKINTSQIYYVILDEKKTCNFTNGHLNISKNGTVVNKNSNHKFESFVNIVNHPLKIYNDSSNNNANPSLNNFKYGEFTTRIDSTTDESALEKPGVRSNNMVIKYTIGGKDVKYYLTNDTKGEKKNRVEFETVGSNATVQSLGLKIVGTSQWIGKGNITGQNDNFSDLSKLTQRAQIKKNAYNLIKGRIGNGDIINDVKYIDCNISNECASNNYTINDTSTYETIIIKDGNLIIKNNLDGDSIGIIVLNSKKDYGKINGVYKYGNVFVNKDVKEINAIIYADGGFISVKDNGDVYNENNSIRTSDLQEQLWLNGALFSKNTIGGAVAGTTGLYKLPGGADTSKFNEAMIYDLNYIRSGNKNHMSNLYRDYAFIINFDSKIQANPPKGFSK